MGEMVDKSNSKIYDEAINRSDNDKWIDDMNEEMNSLIKNQNWITVPIP